MEALLQRDRGAGQTGLGSSPCQRRTAGPGHWAHKLDSPLRSRISDEGQIDGPILQGPGHLAAVCPISNTHGQRLDRSLFPDIQIRLAALPGHLHIPSTGRPDCFLHSQLQRRTLSRGNTVCHASSEAYRPASKDSSPPTRSKGGGSAAPHRNQSAKNIPDHPQGCLNLAWTFIYFSLVISE